MWCMTSDLFCNTYATCISSRTPPQRRQTVTEAKGGHRRLPVRGRHFVIILLALVVLLGLSSSVRASGPLTAPAIAASPGSIDLGQNETLYTSQAFSGGTFPYTCQWLEKAPGAASYSNLNATFSCDTSSLPSITTYPPLAGTWKFELKVIDNSSLQAVSRALTVSVSSALRPSVSASSNTIDSGQTVNITVSWTGGISPYSIALFNSSTSTCGISSTVVGSRLNQPSSPYTFNIVVPSSEWYCAVVTDSAGAPATATSSATEVVANPVLTAPVVTALQPMVDVAQSSNLSASVAFTGGTPLYTCRWLEESPTAHSFSNLGNKFACTTSDHPAVSTGSLSTLGYWYFELQVTDGSGSPALVSSLPVSVKVNLALVVHKIIANPKLVESGQSSIITNKTVLFSGGTPPYTCRLLAKAPGNKSYSVLISSIVCNPSTTPVSTGLLNAAGSWSIKFSVTDSSGVLTSVASSGVTINVRAALGTPIVSPYSAVTDAGQSVKVRVTWSGGFPKYTIQLYSSPYSSCLSPTLVAVKTGQSSQSYVFKNLPALTANTWYCAKVTDSYKTPVTTNSVGAGVTVYPALVAAVITARPPAVDSGGYSLLNSTASPSGGLSSYICQWLKESPGLHKYSKLGLPFSCSSSSLPTVYTPTLPKTGTWYFELETTDVNKVNVFSVPVSVTVNPPLVAPRISAPATAIHGQNVTLSTTVMFSGGTPTYVCQWQEEVPGAAGFTNIGGLFSCSVSTPPTTSAGPLSAGTWYFRLQVTDSAGATVNSAPVQVKVT